MEVFRVETIPSDKNRIPTGLCGGFFIYDATGDEEIYYADPNVVALFGCETLDEFRAFTGNTFRGMVDPEDLRKVEEDILAQTFNSDKRHDYVRYRIRTKQGGTRYIEDFGHLVYGSDGAVYYYVFIVDVKEEEFLKSSPISFAESEIFARNHKLDPLTGLLNMAAFYDTARSALLERAADGEYPTAVVVFDLLGIRDVNRTRGRDEGDARIRALASAMREHMPEGSHFFRGDEAELISVCPNRTEAELTDSIARVVNACKSTVLYGIGSTLSRSPGYGGGEEPCTMLQALEEAHYALKVKKMLNANSSQSQSLTTLVRSLQEVDPDTGAHVSRTRSMGAALGRKIGLSDAQMTSLQLLCLLHDIGKITVPLEILNKPGKLTDQEWAMLRTHSDKGYQIAMTSAELRPIAEMIRYHHERWDGRGYPTGMSREEIPVLSRIIAIVDAYDAMVNDRAYRAALLPERAQKEIRDNAGTQFDPFLALEFLNMLEEHPSLAMGSKTGATEVRVFDSGQRAKLDGGNTLPIRYIRYTLDIDDRIIDVDDGFEALTGYTRAECVGKLSQVELVPPEDRAQYLAQVRDQFTRGDTAFLQHRLRRKDGSVINVICNGTRHFDSSVRAFRSTILVFQV